MRTIVYSIINKETHKKEFWSIDLATVNKEFEKLENKDNYVIGYKWRSF